MYILSAPKYRDKAAEAELARPANPLLATSWRLRTGTRKRSVPIVIILRRIDLVLILRHMSRRNLLMRRSRIPTQPQLALFGQSRPGVLLHMQACLQATRLARKKARKSSRQKTPTLSLLRSLPTRSHLGEELALYRSCHDRHRNVVPGKRNLRTTLTRLHATSSLPESSTETLLQLGR